MSVCAWKESTHLPNESFVLGYCWKSPTWECRIHSLPLLGYSSLVDVTRVRSAFKSLLNHCWTLRSYGVKLISIPCEWKRYPSDWRLSVDTPIIHCTHARYVRTCDVILRAHNFANARLPTWGLKDKNVIGGSAIWNSLLSNGEEVVITSHR